MIFLFFEGYFLGNFQKNGSQKPSMLEEKQGQFWNLHRIPNKTSNPESFEGSETHFTGEANVYIYAYIEYY